MCYRTIGIVSLTPIVMSSTGSSEEGITIGKQTPAGDRETDGAAALQSALRYLRDEALRIGRPEVAQALDIAIQLLSHRPSDTGTDG
jgi:hypothetical protein